MSYDYGSAAGASAVPYAGALAPWYGTQGDNSGGPKNAVDMWGRSNRDSLWQRQLDPGGFFNKGGPPGYSASDEWARITREQYEDTKATYWPLEDYLKGIVNNPAERATAVQGARNLADSSFQGLEGSIDRRLASYGTKLTPEQQAAQHKSIGLSRSLADVDAGNRAESAVTDRDLALAGGGLASNVGSLAAIQNQRARG